VVVEFVFKLGTVFLCLSRGSGRGKTQPEARAIFYCPKPAASISREKTARRQPPLADIAIVTKQHLALYHCFRRCLGTFGCRRGAGDIAYRRAGIVVWPWVLGPNLVRDVITGFFILLEDQYGLGDYVSVAG